MRRQGCYDLSSVRHGSRLHISLALTAAVTLEQACIKRQILDLALRNVLLLGYGACAALLLAGRFGRTGKHRTEDLEETNTAR